MKTKMKFLPSFAALSILGSLSLSSCQKSGSGSFDSYFYLSKPIGISDPAPKNTVIVDGTNYGSVQYIASPVTTQSPGINHVKLPFGRHNYTVNDASNKAIISGYIEFRGNEAGSGSWGSAGGGDSCNSVGSNGMMVGMFK